MSLSADDATIAAQGFSVHLPGAVVLAAEGASIDTCANDTVTAHVNAQTITVSGATKNGPNCAITVSVTSAVPNPGYLLGLPGTVTGVSPAFHHVTYGSPSLEVGGPVLTGEYTDTAITVGQKSTLTLQFMLIDVTPTVVRGARPNIPGYNGLGFTYTLPSGLVVSSPNADNPSGNDCGGTASATAGQHTISLTGGSVTSDGCTLTVPVQGTAGTYPISGPRVTSNTGNFGIGMPNGAYCDNMVALGARPARGRATPASVGPDCEPADLIISPASQTINFTQPGTVGIRSHTATVTATATSGLPVSFDSNTPSVCTVSGSTVTLVSAGTCSITASQTGNSDYSAATPVTLQFTVTPPPAAPSDVSLAAGVSQITASWQAPGGVTGITGYTATASPGPGSCTTTGTSCVIGGTAGTTYTVTVIVHTSAGDSDPSGPSNEATPNAPVPPTAPPATDLTLTTDKGQISTATPGQQIVFIGTGFAPFSTVVITLYSSPVVLGTVVTDANGNFSKAIRIPANLAVGSHTTVAQGVAPDGTPRAMDLEINVGSSAGGGLPVTGTPLAELLAAALLLLVVGVRLRQLGGRPIG